jgi:hypothetical protein
MKDVPTVSAIPSTVDESGSYDKWQDLLDEIDILLAERNFEEVLKLIDVMKGVPDEYHDLRLQYDM